MDDPKIHRQFSFTPYSRNQNLSSTADDNYSHFNMSTSDPSSSAYSTPPNSHGNQPFSPVDSTTGTPANQSPASPRSSSIFPHFPVATRQLRPPKSPMYIPAVLRPTERPHRPAPLTPPRSVHGSSDSLDHGARGDRISRRSTMDSQSSDSLGPVTAELGRVEGLPTRTHWKLDANAAVCDAPTCHKFFSLFERRHHCRHCGHVFCNTDSHYAIPLDHRAEFHPDGAWSRACKHCWDRYCAWNTARLSNAGSIASASTTTPSTPIDGGSSGHGKQSDGHRGSIANSLPRDWNWSTF